MFVIMLVYIGAMLDLCGKCQSVLVQLLLITTGYRGLPPVRRIRVKDGIK